MTDHEFLKSCGLTQEWGVRWRTHVGVVDTWYDSKEIADDLLDEEALDRGARAITRWVTEERIFDEGRWKWSSDWVNEGYAELG